MQVVGRRAGVVEVCPYKAVNKHVAARKVVADGL